MLQKWKQTLTGGAALDAHDPHIAKCIANTADQAKSYWNSLHKPEAAVKREYLWDDLQGGQGSHLITIAYNRIRCMALAYAIKDSPLAGNAQLKADIISALDWMYENRYRDGLETYSNWWHWQIGAPLALNDTVILMDEDLSQEQIAKYMRAVDHFAPDLFSSKHTAANRIWICLVMAGRSVILQDRKKLYEVRDAISPVFPYVREGDGFYKDGSFIQHGRFAYTGSYGKSLLGDISKLLALFSGTEWEVKDPQVRHVYEWVFNSFAPIMYRGSLMDMTRGREISRYYSQEHEAGHGVIDAVLRLSTTAPAEIAERMRRLVKHWIISDTYRNYLDHAPLELIPLAKQLLGDEKLVPESLGNYFKMFGCMDRAVHHRQGFAFGISMFSCRIRNYEVTNGENLKGWYTGHGQTYLYNADLGQFSNAFWPTVNAYRLPGTTVTSAPLADGYGWHWVNSKSWVGGVGLQNQYGAVGMELEDYRLHEREEPLTARKSWFLFDDEVVALGSGIQAGGSYNVETIVENRMLNEKGDNAFTVDGVVQPSRSGWSGKWEAAAWMHLKGDTEGADIGYYFPGSSPVHALRETRTGKWSDISKGENNQECENIPLTRSYLTIWYDHGVKPKDQSYAYVLLPGASAERTSEYAGNPPIQIVEQSADAHSVYHRGLRLLGALFWKDGPKSVGAVTCWNKAAVMMRETADAVEIAVADPTHLNQGSIRIEIGLAAKDVIYADDRLTVEQLHPFIRLSVSVEGAMGASFQAKFAR